MSVSEVNRTHSTHGHEISYCEGLAATFNSNEALVFQ